MGHIDACLVYTIAASAMTSLCHRAQANAPAASFSLRHVRRRRAPRLDESIMQGVPGLESAMHHRLDC